MGEFPPDSVYCETGGLLFHPAVLIWNDPPRLWEGARRKRHETSATELRSVIDEITLAVADKTERDIATRIADEPTLYIDQLREEQRMLTDR